MQQNTHLEYNLSCHHKLTCIAIIVCPSGCRYDKNEEGAMTSLLILRFCIDINRLARYSRFFWVNPLPVCWEKYRLSESANVGHTTLSGTTNGSLSCSAAAVGGVHYKKQHSQDRQMNCPRKL